MAPTTRRYRADLHVHTALSACAAEAMTPPAVVAAAQQRGIDVIGALDHNAAANARAMVAAAGRADGRVHVLPGLEVQSAEGVHVVCLCDTAEDAEALQQLVWDHLPSTAGDPEVTDRQLLLDALGEPVGRERRPLWERTEIELADLCRECCRRGALVIPAHVTRPMVGLISLLGCVPADLAVDALESGPECELSARAREDLERCPQVAASDAHTLEEIGSACTDFWLAEPTVAELRLALRGESGRRAVVVAAET